MLYEKPEIKIILVEEPDVVRTSLTGNGFNDEQQEGGDSTSTGGNEW